MGQVVHSTRIFNNRCYDKSCCSSLQIIMVLSVVKHRAQKSEELFLNFNKSRLTGDENYTLEY